MNKYIAISAGGTGGHINAALSLGERFQESGFEVLFFTGTRYLDYQLFKDNKSKVLHLDSRPLRSKNPLILFKNVVLNLFVFLSVIFKLIIKRPSAILGAGGYVCGPTLLAGKLLGIKVYIIEQNAVAGLTNKLLSKISNKVFLNFENTRGIKKDHKLVIAGNPIRSKIKYSDNETSEEVRILVFGGSLGAKQINDAVEKLVKRQWPKKIHIIHQVGRGNLSNLEVSQNIKYEQKEYLNNMDELYQWANIIIARAGASTISELRVARRPSILVPFPFATDNHQKFNAEELKKENCFYVNVIDYNKNLESIEQDIFDAINEVVEKNLYSPIGECANLDACKIIFEQVVNDVRN
ncbi:MAG: UDP-N-acetylglucosamine--N-acetylmuramyl-(pentapeptide) pyrophosphoryl-undecaprenol N-acetylglucosamine transferase [Bacteriovoracaceae bacterium]|nr:UDP-N-acetylglucosamine--N-acetylmuramyl-(pentapeptide) pyrophosphoryl-undecaprenol N-acetylglucosamine transferase [Bacteriovoracaceae bacterium]